MAENSERRESFNLTSLVIKEEVFRIISDVASLQVNYVTRDGWVIMKNPDYPYTFIDISPSNRSRLSAYSVGLLNSMVHRRYDRPSKPNTPISEFFELYQSGPPYPELVEDAVMALKGTFIKISNLLKKFYPDADVRWLTTRASAIADALRIKAESDTSAVLVSDTPSAVYTLNSDYVSSCMIGLTTERFKLYDDLVNTKIAYLLDERGKLRARALMHSNVVTKRGGRINIMDRIYADNSQRVATLINFAHQNGFHTKESPGSGGCSTYIHPREGTIVSDLLMETHDIIKAGYTQVPYIDTFRCLLRSDILCSATSFGEFRKCLTLFQRTGGADTNNIIIRQRRRCDHCDRNTIDYVREGGTTLCTECRAHYIYCHSCDTLTVRSESGLCPTCLRSSFRCPDCNVYYHKVDGLFDPGRGSMICNECYEYFYGQFRYCRCCGNPVKRDKIRTYWDIDPEETNIHWRNSVSEKYICDECAPLFIIPETGLEEAFPGRRMDDRMVYMENEGRGVLLFL